MTTKDFPIYHWDSWEHFAASLKGKGRSSINPRLYRGQRNPKHLLSSVWEREVIARRASVETLTDELR